MQAAVSFQFNNHDYYTLISDGESISFGTHKKDSVKVPGSNDHMLFLQMQDGTVTVRSQGQIPSISKTVIYNEIQILCRNPLAILYVSRITGRLSESVDLPYDGTISVGRQPDANDIVVTFPVISRKHFQIQCESGKVYAQDLESTNHLFLNGIPITRSRMNAGDVLSVFTCRFLLQEGRLYFENVGSSLRISDQARRMSRRADSGSEKIVGRADGAKASAGESTCSIRYHLSPRIREELPSEPIILSLAPAEMRGGAARRNNPAYLISSGAMLAASLTTGMMNPLILLARMGGIGSTFYNMFLGNKLSKEEQQKLEEYEKLRHEKYESYMANEKARIRKTADVQRRIITRENGEPSGCLETVDRMKRNLWERLPSDSDFLVTRLGTGKQKLCVEVKSRAQAEGFQMEDDDELQLMAERIIEETKYVDNMPVTVPLGTAQTVGLIGSTNAVYYLLRNLLVEVTAQQSANDVRLAVFFDEEARGRWGILRWLPHIWDETGQTRYIAFDRKRIHLICEMLREVVKERKGKAEDGHVRRKDEALPLPRYLVVVGNRDLIKHEAVYDSLISNDPSLGITVIILSEDLYGLPQTTQYIVDLTEKPCVYERSKYNERTTFTPDSVIHQAQLETYTRKMSAIELESSRQSRIPIPQSVTFLEGYHVQTVEELDVAQRWADSKPYQTLEAPLGVMEGGRTFSLDVRSGETSHGPHGLLAGTTGSGKSELLQSWILSMAVNYHPHDVNFVIIDYKGGGMSDLMEPLPHVVGKITNIDRNIGRSLVALKSELKRRQKLFAQAGVNNIDKYQKAFKNGEVKTRLPHLILVTDEFAELKKEEPEFLAELNSVATIGRSLGVHMLLATQRPAGVVTDQINANSRFRICMKVQDAADSREMLKRPDAAKITQSGRAYIRVGEDELFELFQAFYSGAEYTGQLRRSSSDNEVSIVDVTGNRIRLKKKKKRQDKNGVDELTAVIGYIQKVCAENHIEKMAAPWLPELPRWLTLSEIGIEPASFAENWKQKLKRLSLPVGKFDIPAIQSQGIQNIDFTENGTCGVFGIPGSGKTMLLKTVMLVSGILYSPADLQITVIDAGGWSLSEFKDMPHVAEVILNQEEGKVRSCIVRLMKEMEARKKTFLRHAVSSLPAYRESVSDKLPAILLVIDQIGPMFETYPEFEEFMNQIAASGASYGIYTIFTSNSTIGIRYKFLQLIRSSITFQLPDKGEYGSIVGPVAGISLPAFAGRALIKGNPPTAFQCAVCDEAKEDKTRHEHLQTLFRMMQENWNSSKSQGMDGAGAFVNASSGAAEGKRVSDGSEETGEAESADVPGVSGPGDSDGGNSSREEDFGFIHHEDDRVGIDADPPSDSDYTDRAHLPVGTDVEDLKAVSLDFSKYNQILVCGTNRGRVLSYMDTVARLLGSRKDDNQVLVFKPGEMQKTAARLEKLITIAADRGKNLQEHRKEGTFREEEWHQGYQQICLVVYDLAAFSSELTDAQRQGFRRLFTKTRELDFVIIAAETRDHMMDGDADVLTDCMQTADCMILLDKRISDYLFCDFAPEADNTGIMLDRAEIALVTDGRPRVLRIG